MNPNSKNRDLFLPTLKSNVADHPIFYNNTNFIANTKAFYKDLDSKLDNNENILKNIINNSMSKIQKYETEIEEIKNKKSDKDDENNYY